MKAELIIPIEVLRGKLNKDGYYFRKYRGQQLDAALGEPVGIEGLNTLLYCWKKFRKFGKKYLDALKHRDWLYYAEVVDLSEYAQYDLVG